ncbi:hypothetical protein A2690_00845 [Candidatus Roizmanbacteria bacterium RIFCSPHIGHO2_01_FULL_39_12b]|uniref:Nucleotidyl transferase AbiEii/AbiGii toxin family protein n=1 Tax=Candidatus Roizmanbacteria bacterium RIFCSPHIGHO2_01_FULL_39_12b TaxID=1802030 RepID=A0A1F7GAT7_9BACT|nr:MAG: hypothetical protein A2690_00845 [Candidatus Roizmanbacteria bacterium RIFCSPHIGHO2_01_FULL_39_12b]
MFPGTLSDNTQNALAILGKSDVLYDAYLAGGSSLALQLGHRLSLDFDFFNEKEFNPQKKEESLKKLGQYEVQVQTDDTMVGVFNTVKFSLFPYNYPLIAPTKVFSEVRLASCEDIAAMKLVAITDRGTKKDYIDLFFLAKTFSFEKMFEFYDKKYHLFAQNKLTVLKSMQYFVDADGSDMPEMLIKTSWEDVKQFMQEETKKLAEKYL